MAKKISKKETMSYGKVLLRICRNMTKNGIKNFSKEIIDSETGNRYRMTMTQIDEW